MRTVPSAPRARARARGARDAHELQRAAAEVEHAAVVERRRVDRREIAVARLLPRARARGSAGRSARAPRRGSRRRCSASRIALVATASTESPRQPARRGELREHVERRQRARDRLARRARRWRPSPRRCAPARRSRRCASTSPRPPGTRRAERVRAEIDHGEALAGFIATTYRRSGGRLGLPAPGGGLRGRLRRSCAWRRAGRSASTSTWRSLRAALVDERVADARLRVHDADAGVDAAGRDHARRALGDDRQALLVGVREQHGELVAADPPDQVGFAQPARQRPGDGLQRLVADGAAVLPVELAEAFEVDHHQAGRSRP